MGSSIKESNLNQEPLNSIKENDVHIELDNYEMVKHHHQQVEECEDINNTLEEELATVLITCTKKLQSFFVVISMLNIGDVDEYATYKTLCNI